MPDVTTRRLESLRFLPKVDNSLVRKLTPSGPFSKFIILDSYIKACGSSRCIEPPLAALAHEQDSTLWHVLASDITPPLVLKLLIQQWQLQIIDISTRLHFEPIVDFSLSGPNSMFEKLQRVYKTVLPFLAAEVASVSDAFITEVGLDPVMSPVLSTETIAAVMRAYYEGAAMHRIQRYEGIVWAVSFRDLST
ncbi:hypothetical protein J6590_028324 [Homalodisca vitripennis]|nr:hypothetical protein J6590_028324 [Homalodisca vitripennis]